MIRGCVPKKLLVYGAHFAEDLQDARRFGWKVGDCKFDWPTLRDNVLAEVERLEGIYTDILERHEVEIIAQRATVTGPQRGHARRRHARSAPATILIATGAHPVVPDVPGAEHGITSNEVFHLDAMPKRVGDRRRRLYRQRVRRHLPRVRLPGDDRQSRRPHPAPL